MNHYLQPFGKGIGIFTLKSTFRNEFGDGRVSAQVLTSILRATKNYGRASKNHLIESAGIPFSLFDNYFRYAVSNGLVDLKETPSENLYHLTEKGLEILVEQGETPLDVRSSC